MEEHKRILRNVGLALLIVGLLDVGVMVYCIANKVSYSSSFNVFAVIAGVLLLRGSIKTARVVEFFASFMLIGIGGMLLAFLALEPLSLKLARFNTEPIYTGVSYVFAIAGILFIFWVSRELTRESVIAARKEAGFSTSKSILAYALGGALAVGLTSAMYLMNYGDSGRLARDKAQQVYGKEYEYYVNGMNWSGSRISAQLLAFNEMEILHFTVECDTMQLTNGSSGCSLRSPG